MENEIINLLSQLVEINSINPTLSKGPGEENIAKFVAGYLTDLGLTPEIQTVQPDRTNVVVTISASNNEKSLLLNAHLDTVGVEGMKAPFQLNRDGNRLYGRGGYDMKGSVVIMLLLAKYFSENESPIDLHFTFVADEEDKSIGMEYIVEKWLPDLSNPPDAGIFLEPTELDIGICHKGFSWYEIEVTGKAAHGSRPEQGIDAILPLSAALEELKNINTELSTKEPHPLLGKASLHTGFIEGGGELSVIPHVAKLQWERRTLSGEEEKSVNSELDRVLDAVDKFPGDHTVQGKFLFSRAAHEVPRTSEIIQKLQQFSPNSNIIGCSFWADSALGGTAGFPSILFGPVGHGAHAVDEWVSLKSLVELYEVLKTLVKSY